jgi:predicted nucleic acid-binding protein
MPVYVDTSVLVAAHTREPHTGVAQAWLAEQSGGGLILSTWALLECESALAIKWRRGELDDAGKLAASADIEAFAAYFAPWAVANEADHLRARELCRHAPSGLRAGDALHLALALRLKASHFATLDRILGNNAAAQGMALAIPRIEP